MISSNQFNVMYEDGKKSSPADNGEKNKWHQMRLLK